MALISAGASSKALQNSRAHQHEHYEIVLNLEGEGTTEIGGEITAFFPGSIHIVPPKTPHSKEADIAFRDIYFHTDILPFPIDGAVALRDDGAETLRRLIQLLLVRYLQKKQGDRILQQFYELAMSSLAELYHAAPSDPAVERLQRHLALSFNDPELSIGALLEESGYHKDHIRRRFIAATGKTPNAYLTELRMAHAKRLLTGIEGEGFSIAQVGVMCGYYDTHYFSRVFRDHFGKSPTAFMNASTKDAPTDVKGEEQ